MSRGVVFAFHEAVVSERVGRLLPLIDHMRGRGWDVEVVLAGDGPDISAFRALGNITVLDELRRLGPARPFHRLGAMRVASAIKRLRLRRWVHRHRGWIVVAGEPQAAGIVRHLRGRSPRLIACLMEPSRSPGRVEPQEGDGLEAADGWIVGDEDTARAVGARFGRPVEVLISVVDRTDLSNVTDPQPGTGTVVLIGPAVPWSGMDLRVEATQLLLDADPDLRVRWLVADEQGEWLAHHDLAHAALTDDDSRCEVRRVDGAEALHGAGMVLRLSSELGDELLLLSAALNGVPVIDQSGEHPASLPAPGILDLERLVEQAMSLRKEPARAAVLGREAGDRLMHLDPRRQAQAITTLIRGASE